MVMDKICTYLSRLDGVKVGVVHESHSRYFQMTDIRVRVSDHFAIKANFPTTLNIVCEKDDFVVTYGNKILPVKNYSALRELLRNFAMVSDILAPLAETRRKPLVIEKAVSVEKPVVVTSNPTQDDPNWIWVGDLDDSHKAGCRRNVENVRKMVATRPKPKKKKKN